MVPPSPPSVKGFADKPVAQKDPTLKALMPQTEWSIFSQGGEPMLGQLTTKTDGGHRGNLASLA